MWNTATFLVRDSTKLSLPVSFLQALRTFCVGFKQRLHKSNIPLTIFETSNPGIIGTASKSEQLWLFYVTLLSVWRSISLCSSKALSRSHGRILINVEDFLCLNVDIGTDVKARALSSSYCQDGVEDLRSTMQTHHNLNPEDRSQW